MIYRLRVIRSLYEFRLVYKSISKFRRRVSAHVSSSSTSDSSSDSEGIGPLANGDLDSRPQGTARLAKSTALKRIRLTLSEFSILFFINTYSYLDVYQQT